ncbi:MAG: hypothetical protein AAGF12_29750, partial [Myxococcota bacterium]
AESLSPDVRWALAVELQPLGIELRSSDGLPRLRVESVDSGTVVTFETEEGSRRTQVASGSARDIAVAAASLVEETAFAASFPVGSTAPAGESASSMRIAVPTLATLLALPSAASGQDTCGPFENESAPALSFMRDPSAIEGASAPDGTGLSDFDRQARAYRQAGEAYAAALERMIDQRFRRRRRELGRRYRHRIAAESQAEQDARQRAIRQLETFLRRYPNDRQETPRAMARLGELYFDGAQDFDPAVGPDFSSTVALYRDLVARFPRYSRIGDIHYLLGYCLDETGDKRGARDAFAAFVCPGDDYRSCPALTSDLAIETWMRIGEFHFSDDPAPDALDRALLAYERAARDSSHRLFGLATYKVAWTLFRLGDHPASFERFSTMLRGGQGTGQGGELDREAELYLAILLYEGDWDGDGEADDLTDPTSLLDRLDAGLLSPADDHAVRVYRALGEVLGADRRYSLAEGLFDRMTRWFPDAGETFESASGLLSTYQRDGELARAERILAWLSEHLSEACEECVEATRDAALAVAFSVHRSAQRLRAACGDAACPDAMLRYGRAVDHYRRWLSDHRQHPRAEDVTRHLAEALYWSERFVEAAATYRELRDQGLRYALEASEGVVRSLQGEVDRQSRIEGGLRIPDAPTLANRRAVSVDPPALVQELFREREAHLALLGDHASSDPLGRAYRYNNGRLLFLYGHFAQARAYVAPIWQAGCDGSAEGASEPAALSWMLLRDMAILTRDTARLTTILDRVEACGCDFGYRAAACELAEGPACIPASVPRLRSSLREHVGQELLARAESEGDRNAYRRASAAFEAAAASADAPARFLEQAASAAANAGDSERADDLYRRASAAPNAAPEETVRALFQRGLRAERIADLEAAAGFYRSIVSEPYGGMEDLAVATVVRDAWVNLALVLERRGDVEEAALAYREVGARLDGDPQREALLKVGVLLAASGRTREARPALSAFLERFRSEPRADLVEAQYWFAMLQRGRTQRTELEKVVALAEDLALSPGSEAARLAASAALQRVRPLVAELAGASLRVRPARTAIDYVEALSTAVAARQVEIEALRTELARVRQFQVLGRSLDAAVLDGALDQGLAQAIQTLPIVLPADVEAALRRVPAGERPGFRAELEARFQTEVETLLAPVECRAIAQYAAAVRTARRSDAYTAAVSEAHQGLLGYGLERVEACLAVTDRPAEPGEFERPPSGQLLPEPVLPPPLH